MCIINPRRMRERGYESMNFELYSSCVCLSGQNKLLRLLTSAGDGAYRLYMTNARFETCRFH